MLYSQGSYGEKASESIERGAKTRDICIGYNKKLSSDTSDADMLIVVQKLREARTRVVIVFTEDVHRYSLARILNQEHYQPGEFIFVGGDGWGLNYLDPKYYSSLFTGYLYPENPQLTEYYGNLTKENNPENPWFQQIYDYNETCARTAPVEECYVYDYLNRQERTPPKYTATLFDGIETVAHGLDALINTKCSNVPKSELRRCVTGPDLLDALYKVDFDSLGGRVHFDKDGDIISVIAFLQYREDTEVNVCMCGHCGGVWALCVMRFVCLFVLKR